MSHNDQKQRIKVLDVGVDPLTLPEALRQVDALIQEEKSASIVTPNPEIVLSAQENEIEKQTINDADLLLADGIGLIWAARYIDTPEKSEIWSVLRAIALLFLVPFNAETLFRVIPERVTGVDMLMEIANLSNSRGYRLFFLGAEPGVARETANRLQTLYPRLRVAGFAAGPPFDEKDEVIKKIKKTEPDLVFLAFPHTKQLEWIREVLPELEDVIFMGIGGAFDFIVQGSPINAPDSTVQKRAPLSWQKFNLEWLWRLVTQPWRWKRILSATIGFILKVIRWKLSHLDFSYTEEDKSNK